MDKNQHQQLLNGLQGDTPRGGEADARDDRPVADGGAVAGGSEATSGLPRRSPASGTDAGGGVDASARAGSGPRRRLGALSGVRAVPSVPEPRHSWDAWVAQGETLAQAIKMLPWTVGDWIFYGEDAFGSDAVWQHLDSLGMDYARLSNYAWLARSIPPGERRADVSWSAHRLVATRALPPEARALILLRASNEGLTTAQVAEIVRETTGGAPPPARCVCPTCGHSHQP